MKLAVWSLRHQRKGLHQLVHGQTVSPDQFKGSCLWQPRRMNWWIGILFACGSILFMFGGILSLMSMLTTIPWFRPSTVNLIFFAGSIPFTSAAYLQLYQSANAPGLTTGGNLPAGKVLWFGWQPRNIGWLSSALQFAGTLLFNINTFDALLPNLDWLQQDLVIWAPDLAGSILFLASGYLAFIEYSKAYWAWQPHNLSWRITFVNLLGCVAFVISAVLAFVPPTAPAAAMVTLSTPFTILGAAAFLTGSLLMLPEAIQAQGGHAMQAS
jgi:hypothetical protein